MIQKFNRVEIVEGLKQGPAAYNEFFRTEAMSAGLYRLESGASDPQQPHAEDEIYYILSGEGAIFVEGEESPVGPGDFVYVRAGDEHRFVNIVKTLEILVVFAPAESAS